MDSLRLLELRRLRRMFAAFAVGATLSATSAWSAVPVSSADHICSSSENPCVVRQTFEVAPGALLDFGLRTLRIEGSGVLDFPVADADLRCGQLEIARSGVALLVGEARVGAAVRVAVQRGCSLSPALPCLVDFDCGSVGAGMCLSGDGGAIVGGDIEGGGANPGTFFLRAVGEVVVNSTISMNSTRSASDGGSIEIESTQFNVTVNAAVRAKGGGESSGGSVSLLAAGDVTVRAPMDVSGGDYDGGAIVIVSAGDTRIESHLRADSTNGAGTGGEIEISAGRDVVVEGGGPASRMLVSVDGHQSGENYGGDGGSLVLEAERDVRVSRYVRVSASAAAPDGFGDTVSIVAERDIDFEGEIAANGRGGFGGAALVELEAGAELRLASTAWFDLTGAGSGGDLYLQSGGGLRSAASIDVSSSPDGVAGRVIAHAEGDAVVTGKWITAGGQWALSFGDLWVEACDVTVAASLVNTAQAGRTRILAHEQLVVSAAGALISNGGGATNSIRYRTTSKPPELLGSVLPSAALAVDASLSRCARCGDGELDVGETCDDANTVSGDGCSPRCQNEGCESEGAGGFLCDDDNECTQDRCDVNEHRCVHQEWDCSDGVACTQDLCRAGECTHLPADNVCDDKNLCTEDQCSIAVGCWHRNVEQGCDDGLFCNGQDRCFEGQCRQHSGDPCRGAAACQAVCQEQTDQCLAPRGTPCEEDANECTQDQCGLDGQCEHLPVVASCSGADFCGSESFCSDGVCRSQATPALMVSASTMRAGTVEGLDRGRWQMEVPASFLLASPAQTGVRFRLSSPNGQSMWEAHLRSGLLAGEDGKWLFKASRGGAVSGVVRAQVSLRRGRTVARVRLKLDGAPLGAAMEQDEISLAVVFGDQPIDSPCASSGVLLCRRKGDKMRCESSLGDH